MKPLMVKSWTKGPPTILNVPSRNHLTAMSR